MSDQMSNKPDQVPTDDRLARYARQIIFPEIGRDGQQRLLDSRVVLVGCGADGTAIADRLVRAGIGHLTIIDRDYIELNNLQRQVLYDEDDISANLPKAVAAERKLRRINSQVTVQGVVADLTPDNVQGLLTGADLVMDGTDNFETRYLVNDMCVKHQIPWIYCGVVAGYGMTMTIVPHRTPCLRCVFPAAPDPRTTVTCDTAGILNTIVTVVAGIAVTEATKLLIRKGELIGGITHVDLWDHSFDVFESAPPRGDCPSCGQGHFDYLEMPADPSMVRLCGRSGVQVSTPGNQTLSLESIASRLRGKARILAHNDYLLRFEAGGHQIAVFPDGRAIIKGIEDEELARALYFEYIGGGE